MLVQLSNQYKGTQKISDRIEIKFPGSAAAAEEDEAGWGGSSSS